MEIDAEEGNVRVIDDYHEEEFYLSADQLVEFLRNLADEIEQGDELEISTDDWKLPFSFDRQQIEVEVEHQVDELEIELEFDRKKESRDLSV